MPPGKGRHQPGDGAGGVRGQAEAGEGRPKRSDPATEDTGVAEVSPHDISHIHGEVHADDVQVPEGDVQWLCRTAPGRSSSLLCHHGNSGEGDEKLKSLTNR